MMSNPKFVTKSRMILGANKYIGGTYRNTTLAQQKANQSSKSSAELQAISRGMTSNNGAPQPLSSSSHYDASNYAAGTSTSHNAGIKPTEDQFVEATSEQAAKPIHAESS